MNPDPAAGPGAAAGPTSPWTLINQALRLIERWQPAVLLLILAIPAILIMYAFAAGITSPRWFASAALALGVPTIVVGFVTSLLSGKAQGTQMTEQSNEQFLTATSVLAVLAIDLMALVFRASTSPDLGVIIIGVAAAWILLWTPRTLRRVGIRTSVVIRRDLAAVFAFVSDFQNGPKYMAGLESVEKITNGPIGVGTQFRSRMRMPNGVFEGVEEIVDYEPPSRMTSRVSSGLRPNIEVLTFEPVDRGTRLKHRFNSELSYSSALIGSGVLRWLLRWQLISRRKAAWAKLKQILES